MTPENAKTYRKPFWLHVAFYLVAQKLVFCNSGLDKSTTAPPFVRWGIWNVHVHKVRVCEVYAHEVQAHGCKPMRCTPIRYTPIRYTPIRCAPVYTHKVHTYEAHAGIRP